MLQHPSRAMKTATTGEGPALFNWSFNDDIDFVLNQLEASYSGGTELLDFGESLETFANIDFANSTDGELSTWARCTSPTPVVPLWSMSSLNSAATGFKRNASGVQVPPPSSSSSLQDSINALKASAASQAKRDGGTISPPSGMRVKRVKMDELFPQEALTANELDQSAHDQDGGEDSIDEAAALKSSGQSGESRLRINFVNYGTVGTKAQYFGKSGHVIPHRLTGTHEMYDQPWQFTIEHVPQTDSPLVLVIWRITNLSSGTQVSMKETPQQANRRAFSGRTICNKVVKLALSTRAQELQAELATVTGAKRSAMECAIRALQPRLCTVGLLFFGLLHESVQVHLRAAGRID